MDVNTCVHIHYTLKNLFDNIVQKIKVFKVIDIDTLRRYRIPNSILHTVNSSDLLPIRPTITEVPEDLKFKYVDTAGNRRHAIVISDKVGLVSGKYSEIIIE